MFILTLEDLKWDILNYRGSDSSNISNVQFKTIINNIRNNSVIELKHYDIDNQ